MNNIKECALYCIEQEKKALDLVQESINNDFEYAAKLIASCTGCVITSGIGKSKIVASKISNTLNCTGVRSYCSDAVDLHHGGLGGVCEDDLFLVVSRSGNTKEIVHLIKTVKESFSNIKIIALTCTPTNEIASLVDIHLTIEIATEADPLNIMPTSSSTACIVMGDALACAVMFVRQLTREDFARFHPGGELGKKLKLEIEKH